MEGQQGAMAKRFTDSEKWQDRWFRRLPPDQKLAYLYLLDRCDMAGTIELDDELAEFQMGCPTDWEGLVESSEGRIVRLPNGRLWVSKFIAFQHGTLSEKCNAHSAALKLIERYELPVDCAPATPISNENKGGTTKGSGRVQEPLAKGPGNSNSNSNGNSNGKGNGINKEKEEWIIPEHVDSPKVRDLLREFEKMRARIGKPIRSVANTSRTLNHFDDASHLEYAIDFCIGNEYQGLKPEYRPSAASRAGGGAKPVTFAQQREANMRAVGQRFIAAAPKNAPSEEIFRLEAKP